MRFGLLTPVVFRPPGQANPWEEHGDVADIVAVAQAADSLGYHHLTCSEHVVVPAAAAARRGSTYWDPLATLAFLAAETERIRLATHVLVLGYHHPLGIAKRYGTLDRLSNGRLILGLGVGTLREEFELLGAAFADRGARADDALAALRASWGRPVPEYHGAYYDYAGLAVDPHSRRPDVPIWIGGSTARSLRRAIDFGDGWVPFGLTPDALHELLGHVRLPGTFDVVLECPGLDPRRSPDETRAAVNARFAAGATIVNVALRHDSVQDCVEQLRSFKELFPEAHWGRPVPSPELSCRWLRRRLRRSNRRPAPTNGQETTGDGGQPAACGHRRPGGAVPGRGGRDPAVPRPGGWPANQGQCARSSATRRRGG